MGKDDVVVAGERREVALRDVLVGEFDVWAGRPGAGPHEHREERRGRAVERCHADRAARVVDEALDRLACTGQRGLDADGSVGQRTASGGEDDPPPSALGERDRDGALKQPQLL